MNLKKLAICLLLLFNISCSNAQDQDDCVFDPESVNEVFLKENPSVQSYHWDDKSKQATVLMKSGEIAFVKKWACTSYGMEAKQVFFENRSFNYQSELWIDKLLMFGKIFLSKGDYEVYEENIQSGKWLTAEMIKENTSYEINIPHDNYPEFFASIERTKGLIILSFYYYRN